MQVVPYTVELIFVDTPITPEGRQGETEYNLTEYTQGNKTFKENSNISGK